MERPGRVQHEVLGAFGRQGFDERFVQLRCTAEKGAAADVQLAAGGVGNDKGADKNLIANFKAFLQRKLNQVVSTYEEGEEQFWGFVLGESAQFAPIRVQVYDDPELSRR